MVENVDIFDKILKYISFENILVTRVSTTRGHFLLLTRVRDVISKIKILNNIQMCKSKIF